jgi:uncharacterized protein
MPTLDVILLCCSLAIGLCFGILAHKLQFCTMGAIADIVSMNHWLRMRMWVLAIATSIFFTQAGQLVFNWQTSTAMYYSPKLLWLSHIVGGALFGVGMVRASGCAGKTLVRLGAGNLKSLVVLIVMGLFALITLKGLIAVFRVQSLEQIFLTFTTSQTLDQLLYAWLDSQYQGPMPWVLATIKLCPAFVLLYWVLRHSEGRETKTLISGIGIGLCVSVAWALTLGPGFIEEDPETLEPRFLRTYGNRPESLSFVAPVAQFLEWLIYFSDNSRRLTLGVANAAGVVLGSFLHAKASRQFRVESFQNSRDLVRHLSGAAFMGVGAVLALGCSIGQGITGISTLSIGSIITLAAMIIGARWQLGRDFHSV